MKRNTLALSIWLALYSDLTPAERNRAMAEGFTSHRGTRSGNVRSGMSRASGG